MSDTGDIVSRVYGSFRGCDFRGDEVNLSRSPDCLNMWKDYRETESIRTRPGIELFVGYPYHTINGIFLHRNKNGEEDILIHGRDELFSKKRGFIQGGLNDQKSHSFLYNDRLYFIDGKHYWQYNGEEFVDVGGFVPTTSIGRKPSGGGKTHQDVNLLSAYRKNSFLSDGVSTEYHLDTYPIDKDFMPIVWVNDEPWDNPKNVLYTVDYDKGIIKFNEDRPGDPLTDGQDNVVIQFKKTVTGYRERITNCTLLQVFDNRVFFSGNKDYPNVVWHCSLDDPTYFSDKDYYEEGVDTAHIRGLVAGNNALWVFREPSQANTTVFYHTPALDNDYGKIYPSQHSTVTLGCVGGAINFNDDIIFFSERGMEGMSGDVTTEQAVGHRSSMVDRKMLAEDDYKDMILAEWEGYLLVFIGSRCYVADSRATFTNENHREYEWFYWDMGRNVTCATVINGELYLGIENSDAEAYDGGVYKMTIHTKQDMESYWTTPKDKFKSPHKLKTTNKRGCVAEAEGDISVYAKTEDSEYELIGTYEDVEDYFVSRIKRKKWKDIQLKFHSNTRFSLETVTLEAFIGGYIKR